jgi:hypothetical protein
MIMSRASIALPLMTLCLVTIGAAAVPTTDRSATTRPAQRSTQFGAERLDFQVDGHAAFLIRPTRAAADGSRPWLWYAPTFVTPTGYPNARHTWIVSHLLDRGFSIAGIDVGESHGNPQGRASYEALYRVLTTEFALSPKACLLPQSRGGLMLYNWAAEHPEHVQCIGGIYPVCDLESYPGLAKAAPAYGMTVEQLREHLAEHNPIDRLAPLAEKKVQILHIHGDADMIVPLERNSGELIRRYRALGGPGELLAVKGKGHAEVDEFFRSKELIGFFLANARTDSPAAPTGEKQTD